MFSVNMKQLELVNSVCDHEYKWSFSLTAKKNRLSQ